MIGVNIENLDKIVNINNFNYDSLASNITSLCDSIDELEDCYSGDSITSIFSILSTQRDDLNRLKKIVNNYSDILTMVKVSYQKQDEHFRSLMNRAANQQ